MLHRTLPTARRCCLLGVCYVLLGVVASIAVAWAISSREVLTTDNYRRSSMVLERSGLCWLVVIEDARGQRFVHFMGEPNPASAPKRLEYILSERSEPRIPVTLATSVPRWGLDALDSFDPVLPMMSETRQPLMVSLLGSGWPCVCGTYALVSGTGYNGPVGPGRYELWGKYSVPLVPIWSGLIVDSLFYGSIPLALHLVLRVGARWRRRVKGRCPSCAYDRRGLATAATCPECGTMPKAPVP